ncbi:MAG: HEAT repeat domain-containing protein [Planctomycetota bacterium]|jgi:hypothetical protein
MKPKDKIEKLVESLYDTTSSELDQRILNSLARTMDDSQDVSAPLKPNIWRIIMNSRITKLAVAAVILILIALSIKTLSSQGDSDKPLIDPQVVKIDENNGAGNDTNEKENLREEFKQIEQMYAAHNIDGLVTMLSLGQPESKVLAANYLAKIGDARAITALELLDSQSGDTNNPFGQAAKQIKRRLEQETSKSPAKDNNDMNVANLVPAVVNDDKLLTPVNIVRSGSKYDHFLFISHNKPDEGRRTKTLVLAKITPEGIQLQEIDTERNVIYRWEETFGLVGGTLYVKHGEGELSAINLATGQTELIASDDDESVYSLLNVYAGHSYVYDEGRLYGQAGSDDEGVMTLRVLDFRTCAYRDIIELEDELEYTTLAISPEHNRMAYFTRDPNGNLLTVVDIASGQVTHPIAPIEFKIPFISSLNWYAPPLVWIDANRVVCIRTEVWGRNIGEATNKVAIIDVTTGEMEDVVALPGNPHARFVRMTQKYKQAGPRIQISNFGQFSIDLEERRLIEDETVNGDYLVSDEYLFYDEQELGEPSGHKDLEISPDGERAIWISEGKLFYHDSASEAAVPVMEDSNAAGGLLWIRAEDLKAPAVAADIPEGWIAFKDRPLAQEKDDDSEARRERWRARKDIKDHVVLTIETDKDTYLLHEPIEITLTFRSISDRDIEVNCHRIIRSDMDYPGGSKELECAVGPYEPNQDTILLGPGESISATDTIEVALIGDYKIRCEYDRFEGEWREEIEADVAFRVNPVGSDQTEKQLFEAKFERLMDKVRCEGNRKISEYSFTSALVNDEIVGITGMGPNVVPYLMVAIKDQEQDYNWLYRPLKSFVGSEALGFFQDRLIHGAEDDWESACEWLYELFEKGQDGSSEAYAVLLSAMNHENAGARHVVVRELCGIYDPNVKVVFEAAIEDEDEQVRIKVARYLAGSEGLDLDQWLEVAVNKPTAARYIAANSIIKQLEKKWNITKGQFPDVTWKEASNNPEVLEQYRKVVRAWQEWASENERFSSQFFER